MKEKDFEEYIKLITDIYSICVEFKTTGKVRVFEEYPEEDLDLDNFAIFDKAGLLLFGYGMASFYEKIRQLYKPKIAEEKCKTVTLAISTLLFSPDLIDLSEVSSSEIKDTFLEDEVVIDAVGPYMDRINEVVAKI